MIYMTLLLKVERKKWLELESKILDLNLSENLDCENGRNRFNRLTLKIDMNKGKAGTQKKNT